VLLNPTPIPDTTYVDTDSLAVLGCYQVSAIDAYGQEGSLSAEVCASDPAPTSIGDLAGAVGGVPLRIHPNPLQGSAEIVFRLPRPQSVSLVVYSVAGRRVVTLVEDVLPAGTQRVRWSPGTASGRFVAAGTYFLVLRTSKGVETRKVTVVR
jgi:hypothetical protein